MTETAIIVYGGILFAFVIAFLIGRSLDKQQSNENVTVKTGCIGMKTVIQSVILACIVGPIVYLIKGRSEDLWFCVLAMAAAPFVVDLIRPTVTLHSTPEGNAPQITAESASKLNAANAIAIAICVCLLGAFVAWNTLGRNTSADESQAKCIDNTCKISNVK
jgi:hypothetical protein